MGGKAFPQLNTIRLGREQFTGIAAECLSKLKTRFPSNEFRLIESFRDKTSFGDLDILWCGDPQNAEDMCGALGAIRLVKNGPVVSFALPVGDDSVFQVDLIRVACRHMDSAFSYFAFNDLGNLLGRIFHRAGFKLGHKGMCFVIREKGNSSHVVEEVEVTSDWKAALEFAGYDHSRWLEGFDSLEDVFEFAVSTPTANRTIFRLDETSHQARVRDRKRLTYQKFLRWVNDPANNIPEHEVIPKARLREEWLERAFKVFPEFKEKFDGAMLEMERTREANKKFNGNIVREKTGLDGKELGEFMREFAEKVIGRAVSRKEWALSKTESEIEDAIDKWHQNR